MRAIDVRLGNYLQYETGNVFKADLDHIEEIILFGNAYIKPIPLTEEWLLKTFNLMKKLLKYESTKKL